MENAHLRMGKLKFVRQSRDTITEVAAHLHRLVAENPTASRAAVQIHLASVFGGDQEIAAVAAAVADGQHFGVSLPDGREVFGFFGEDAVTNRASVQVPGRQRPVRHLVVIGQEFFRTTLATDGDSRRTILYDDKADFVLRRLAARFGLPMLPDWAIWFRDELRRRRLIEGVLGVGCSPVVVRGGKHRMIRLISAGVRRSDIYVGIAHSCFGTTLSP